ncbi:hypothetical protein [Moraxella sp. ZY210820]|uniref:hypothetical protein n=1 Tax=unclassified Moraxella TaxID=2685852 RepID=UPI00272F434E|nr:hypothetical protein [Moraxella sp. ZY210820]WLF84205.1 hypothetical protein LU301_01520 [Moraxella sp. ZY210820]
MSKNKRKAQTQASYPFWKHIRVVILLIILVAVALNAWRDNNQNWDKPIVVMLHPVNVDGSLEVQQYIQKLTSDDFKDAQQYLVENSQKYRNRPSAIYIQYGREMMQKPPAVPSGGGIIDIMLWSLKFRYYAWKYELDEDKSPTVTLYLNYYNPKTHKVVKHSTALENGRIGIVNLFADMKHHGSNKVIIVHELLHAFGATDKYDLRTGQPLDPIGLAEPNKNPKYPQSFAEIMGGYVATSPSQRHTPNSLAETVINPQTAQEIGWLNK